MPLLRLLAYALPLSLTGLASTSSSRALEDCAARPPACVADAEPCLDATAISLAERLECPRYREFCGKRVYRLPNELQITLPILTDEELAVLYKRDFNAGDKGKFNVPKVKTRAESQFAMIDRYYTRLPPNPKATLRVAEMGCMHGMLLTAFRKWAAPGVDVELLCFEADPNYHSHLNQSFRDVRRQHAGLRARLVPSLFNGASLAPNSLDVFVSSHVLEHIPDPCPWLDRVYQALRPGGLLFTEVPEQSRDPEQKLTRGMFHLLYFSKGALRNLLTAAGFEELFLLECCDGIRGLYQKPLGGGSKSASAEPPAGDVNALMPLCRHHVKSCSP